MSGFHLLLDISGHGFGHLAQASAVVNALRGQQADLRLSIRCPLPRRVIASRVQGDFEHIPHSLDVGMLMASPMDVLRRESAAAYRELHRDWSARVAAEAAEISRLAPHLLLADVPYLSLAAARRAGVPAIALCSLNWADILSHYCAEMPGIDRIEEQIRAAYRDAERFLMATPHMPMTDLPNRQSIGPIARLGRDCGEEIRLRLGLSREQRLVLYSLGGIDGHSPALDEIERDDLVWLSADPLATRRARVHSMAELDMPFTDLLSSADALVTKPGYGSFTEAACNSTRVLYGERGDWPEAPYLNDWLAEHGTGTAVSRQALEAGAFEGALSDLLERPLAPAPRPTGIEDVVRLIGELGRTG